MARGASDETPVDLELGLAEAANRRLQGGEAALASRDHLIASTLETGVPVAEVAKRLGMTEQAIYQIRDRLERGGPITEHIASTARALEDLTDHQAFERASVELLQDLDPSLRHLGGSGDHARDAGGGVRGPGGDEVLVMVSLEAKWSQKIRREFDRIAKQDWCPVEVWAVTNRRTTPKPRDALVADAAKRGWQLRIFDQTWLTSRLLRPEHLHRRERLLGLAPPQPPAFLTATEYVTHVARRGRVWSDFIGRERDIQAVAAALDTNPLVILNGPGGVGKTRLAIELAHRRSDRWVFIDHHATVDLHAINEIVGEDDLVAVIDNAHRREDLSTLIGLLDRRQGPLQVILVTRPGFDDQLINAVADSRVGSLTKRATLSLGPLSPQAIAELLRAAPLSLTYDGAIEAIVRLSEGNPQIAILAAELSKGGTPVEAMSQADLLQGYVASLLASVTSLAGDPDRRVIREVLALGAALERVGRDDNELLDHMAQLTELGRRGLLRVLADLADAGLLADSNGSYFVTPDLLAEHVLWAAFFSSKWQPTIAYTEVWRAASTKYGMQLVRALGRLPGGSAVEDNPAFQTPRADLLAYAESSTDETIGSALIMAREIAHGAPRLATDLVDIGLRRLPPCGNPRDRALTAACEAMERVGEIDLGWPRQLAVAAATYAAAADDKTTLAVVKALSSVYQRVPVNTSERDGALLAGIQRTLAQLTLDYWKAHGGEPGVAQAVAIASRTLLTVTFESHFTRADDPRSVVLRGHALPGSSHTDAALTAGAELFCNTFWVIPIELQLKQLEGLAELRRTERGFPGPFNVQPSADTRELAVKALRNIERELTERLSELSLPMRAEAGDLLQAVPDATLSEYILVAHPRTLRRRGETWEESEERRIADADTALRLLRDADNATDRLDLWATWREQGRAAMERPTSSPVIGMALERAAIADPTQAAGWLRHLVDTKSSLLSTAVPALAVVFRAGHGGRQLAEEWAAHASPEIRALVAMALPGIPGERPLLERLAKDPEPLVRDAVLGSVRYAPDLEAWRIDTALRAARSDDISGVHLVLSLLDRAADSSGATVSLTPNQIERVTEIVLATAAHKQLHNAHELSSIFAQLSVYRPRIALEWIDARLEWLERFGDELRGGAVEEYLRVEPMPPEIVGVFAQAADDSDLRAILDRYGGIPTNAFGFADLASIIASVDHGSLLVTEHMIEWLKRDQDGDSYRVAKLLENPLTWEQFTDRARELLAHGSNPRLIGDLIAAREPMSWSGSRVPHLETAKEQYATWCDDRDERLAAVGREALTRFEHMIEWERERETDEDNGWKWLRPASRV
jgi:transposase-like protein